MNDKARTTTPSFGEHLVNLMNRRGISIIDLATPTLFRVEQIHEMCYGNAHAPDLATAQRLAVALGYPVNALIPGADIDKMERIAADAYTDWRMMQPKEDA